IALEFQRLLARHFKEWKRPAMYAAELAITTSHLNDMVRAATGFSVSYHLQQAMVLEAKRLLTHTDKTVKEITYEIGLEDHGYFSRLFKKVAGQTPVQFRQQFRD
ncbi:MAG TPA: helix-turn-helix domain-containing protein, partial [Chitinophaga sp.]